jgi:polyisoprenyl-phosphate glycosyltransferase
MYTVVIPVYKNEATLDALVARLVALDARLEGKLEAVFVVDGSPDRSYLKLQELLAAAPLRAQLIGLSRNFGSFAAIRMGLSVASGPYFTVMAADLQEPVELAETFFATLRDETVDIVVGAREGRDDPTLSKLGSQLFWRLYRALIQPEIPPGGVDVFGCNLRVRDALMKLGESNSTLVGLLFWVGFRRKFVPYRRAPRLVGKSGWSFRRKLRYMVDSAFAFSDLPINLLMAIGLAGVAISILVSLVVLLAWLFNLIEVAGYTPIMLTNLFSLTTLLFALGILGGYIWRTFENTKGRPLFIPMSHERFGRDAAK